MTCSADINHMIHNGDIQMNFLQANLMYINSAAIDISKLWSTYAPVFRSDSDGKVTARQRVSSCWYL